MKKLRIVKTPEWSGSIEAAFTLTTTDCELTGWEMFLNLFFSLPQGCQLQSNLTLPFLFMPVLQIRFSCSFVYSRSRRCGGHKWLYYPLAYLHISLCSTWFPEPVLLFYSFADEIVCSLFLCHADFSVSGGFFVHCEYILLLRGASWMSIAALLPFPQIFGNLCFQGFV